MAIDFDKAEERAEKAIWVVFCVIGVGLIAAFGVAFALFLPLSGIVMAMDGLWCVGVPIAVAGFALDISFGAWMVVRLIRWIKERVIDGD